MSGRHGRRGDGLFTGRLPALIFLTGCFCIGLVLGCVFASFLPQGDDIGLSSYLEGYFSAVGDVGAVRPHFLATFWEVVRWPLSVGILGLTAFGVLAVPAVFCVRGFLLSYTASVFILIMGSEGLVPALAVFGLSAFLSVAALFIAGMDAFALGLTFIGSVQCENKERTALKRRLTLRLLTLAGCLAVGAVVQNWLSPILLKTAVDLMM